MSGGSDKKPSTKSEEPTPAQATYSQPAFMPGMDTMIAQQLGMGGYGDPASLLAAFGPIFTPMKVPDYRPGATPPPPATNPTTPSGNSGGGGRWKGGGGHDSRWRSDRNF